MSGIQVSAQLLEAGSVFWHCFFGREFGFLVSEQGIQRKIGRMKQVLGLTHSNSFLSVPLIF
jgi:hypothetical protein